MFLETISGPLFLQPKQHSPRLIEGAGKKSVRHETHAYFHSAPSRSMGNTDNSLVAHQRDAEGSAAIFHFMSPRHLTQCLGREKNDS